MVIDAMFTPYLPPPTRYLPRVQGKVAELRFELNSGGKKDKHHTAKRIALKKIVANMTMSNNDMVALFPDVVACMTIQDLEIKKMCFLYLVNYARMRPEVAVKAIPVLERVSEDCCPLFEHPSDFPRTWKTRTR